MDYAGSGAREAPSSGDLNALVASLPGILRGSGTSSNCRSASVPVFAFRPSA